MAHLVVVLTDDLSAAETARALETAPDHVTAGPGYSALLQQAGFEAIEVSDMTDEYLATIEAWAEEWEAEAAGLEALLGAEEFADRLERRHQSVANTRDGLVLRHLVSAAKA